MPNQLLEIRGLHKSFPGVHALAGVNFNLQAGEVHALMGENGAGKSTLIKTLTGVHQRDQGTVLLDGKPVSASSPLQAESLGIKTVYQEVNLIPHLSVAENITIGRQPGWMGMVNWRAARNAAKRALDRLGLNLDLDRELCSYSVAIQQMVAIARAVSEDAKVLILDEPTSSLDENEVDDLFVIIDGLRKDGLGVIFVTHFLDQVYRISDRITVLRSGELVGEYLTAELPRLELVGEMLGKNVNEDDAMWSSSRQPSTGDRHAIEVKEKQTLLEAKAWRRRGAMEPFDLTIGSGEVLGLAGLLGSGRSEIARLLFGLDAATGGKLCIDGKLCANWSPRKAIAAGLAFCPEDRKVDGVIGRLSVRENILLAMQASRSVLKTVSLPQQTALAEHYIDRLRIKTPSSETAVDTLSGGNQQKVLLARWLAMSPKLLILDEPTRGIDVGAKSEVELLVESLRREGMAIIFISSELDEIVRTCQRVAVVRDHQLLGELQGGISEKAIMEMIASAKPIDGAKRVDGAP